MSIEQKIEGNVGKLFLSDEIDLDKSPQVRENLKELMDKVKTVEVQLSKVKYIIKSATGQDALEGSSGQPVEPVEEVTEASENVDLNPSEENNQKETIEENNQSDETKPSIKRDDDDGDKIKFKR